MRTCVIIQVQRPVGRFGLVIIFGRSGREGPDWGREPGWWVRRRGERRRSVFGTGKSAALVRRFGGHHFVGDERGSGCSSGRRPRWDLRGEGIGGKCAVLYKNMGGRCRRPLVGFENTRVRPGERIRLRGEDPAHGKRIILRSVRFCDHVWEAGLMGRRCGIRRTNVSKGG